MLRTLFFILLPLALLGDARVFLFVINRVVFGSHRHEHSPWKWLFYAIPPLLLGLTLLFWPLHVWLAWLGTRQFVELITPDVIERLLWSIGWAKVGAAWLLIAAGIGLYWILDRARLLLIKPPPLPGVRTGPSEIIRMRKAHIPFKILRKLGAHNDLYDLEVTRHEVVIEDLPPAFDGFRIAFLTDTHVAGFVRRAFYTEIVTQVNRFEPDLILLGGDFVTWKRDIPLMAEVLLSDLKARDGMFAILGNHDYWAGGEEVKAAMMAKGVRFIINESVTIRRDGAELPLVGIDEVYRGEPDIEKAFGEPAAGTAAARPAGRRRAIEGPCIAVTHHPDLIDLVENRRIDLMVCGHTHGGQIRFPFFGAVVVPSKHESRYASGFHPVGRVLMYVSRGIGAIPPIRILCRPEIATFILRRK